MRPQRRGVLPYSVHTTFQYSGAGGKTHRLREAMLWEDEPSYFTPPKNLLTYTPVVRRELIKKSGVMDVESHFTLVHHQLTQLRAAMVLARKLDRLLILPELVCGLDRFWAPHNGTIPLSRTALPIYPCPLDHLVELAALAPFPHRARAVVGLRGEQPQREQRRRQRLSRNQLQPRNQPRRRHR